MSVFASRYGLHNRVTIAGQGEGGYDGGSKGPGNSGKSAYIQSILRYSTLLM
jgi:hypothetical protein